MCVHIKQTYIGTTVVDSETVIVVPILDNCSFSNTYPERPAHLQQVNFVWDCAFTLVTTKKIYYTDTYIVA